MTDILTAQHDSSSVGHVIVRQLEEAGVQRVYAVPGESYLDVLDGLHDSQITTVVTRHEGGAGFMALTEGRLTNVPGVALVTRGPGASNAMIAVHTAYQDATPLVLFVGLIPRSHRNLESFQEFNLSSWFGSTAKKVTTIDDPGTAARLVEDAFFTATNGRPGPVVVGLPEDLLIERAGASTVPQRAKARPAPSTDEVHELEQRLKTARRPLIVAGGEHWTQSTGNDLARWAYRHGIPICTDFRAYDVVPHALDGGSSYVGSLGYGRSDALARQLDEADLLIFIGCCRTDVLSDGYTSGLGAITVTATLGDLLGHFGRLDQQILASPSSFVTALNHLQLVEPKESSWLADARSAYESYSTPRADGGTGADVGLCMQVLREELPEKTVITYGAGNHAIWAARYLRHTAPGTLVAPRNGAMGVGVPAAVAAQMVFPERRVLAVEGDGDFGMNGQEFATAVGYGAAIIILVIDNGVYATIREHQEHHYPGRPSGTHLTNPDYAQWAAAHGGHGERVEHADDFRAAFKRAVDSGKPSIIHIIQDPHTRSPQTSDL